MEVADNIIGSIRAYDSGVNGCVRVKKDIMIAFCIQNDKNIYDIFLTQGQAESLLYELNRAIRNNVLKPEDGKN